MTWRVITDLGNAVPVSVVDAMMLELGRLLDRASRWLLLNRPQPLETDGEINRFRPIVQELAPRVPDWLTGQEADNVAAAARRLTSSR